jgi:hypothetical protein
LGPSLSPLKGGEGLFLPTLLAIEPRPLLG